MPAVVAASDFPKVCVGAQRPHTAWGVTLGVRLPLLAIALCVAGCGEASKPLPADAPLLTVCEAGRQPVRSQVKVRGEFSGTDYSLQPKMITLQSEDICNNRGAGLVFADVANRSEMSKLDNARPRGKRHPSTPGDLLTLEGTVTKITEGRFVYLEDAVVTTVGTRDVRSR